MNLCIKIRTLKLVHMGLGKLPVFHFVIYICLLFRFRFTGVDDTPNELNEVYTTVSISVPQTGSLDNNSNKNAATSGPVVERVRTAAVLTVVILSAFFY